MKVISSKGSSTLWALPEAGVIATADAFRAKDVETFCEDCVLFPCTAARAVQFGLGEERKCQRGSTQWPPLTLYVRISSRSTSSEADAHSRDLYLSNFLL